MHFPGVDVAAGFVGFPDAALGVRFWWGWPTPTSVFWAVRLLVEFTLEACERRFICVHI